MKDNFNEILNRDKNESSLVNKINDLKDQNKTYGRLYRSSLISLFMLRLNYLVSFKKRLVLKKSVKTAIFAACLVIPSYYLWTHPNTIILSGKNTKEVVYIDNSKKSDMHFLTDLGYFESRGNYNPSGNESYWGKYQIGRAALDAIGFDQITKEEFIKDSLMQEVAIRRLIKFNKKILAELIGKYEGKTIGDVYVTQSGLLAAAHLGGCGNVKTFLESGGSIIFKDGNGTPITKYMKHFTGYKLHF